jgi:hypothetical protein
VHHTHDGVDVLHKEIETYWNQMKVAWACRSELISREHTVWLLVPVDIGHDRMPCELCRGSSTVGDPLINSGSVCVSISS